MKSSSLTILTFFGASLVAGCADILGTSPFRDCTGSECTSGSGGAGGGDGSATNSTSSASTAGSDDASSSASSGETSGTSSSTGSGPSCFDVTVMVNGDLRVRVAGTDVTYEEDDAGPYCLAAGPVTLQAECHGEDTAEVTSWGNALCPGGGTTCNFDLQEPQTFSVTSTCNGDGGD